MELNWDIWFAGKIESFMRCKTPQELIEFCDRLSARLKKNDIEWDFSDMGEE